MLNMTNHGTVRACVSPEAVKVDENSVWIAENVTTVTVTDESGERTEYEFTLTQYTKDEYIRAIIDKNATLETDMTNTQLALCEVYEMLGTM